MVETKIKLLNHFSQSAKDLRFRYFSRLQQLVRSRQAAYATANECLNKFAQYLRTIPYQGAFDQLGAWDGGMVDDNLKKILNPKV